jgi:RimJ/RimL family protein N-acetyltransferase
MVSKKMIQTSRLKLVCWDARHRGPFAEMHADPEVMLDLGGPISRSESDAKLARYAAAYREHGVSRWAVEADDGRFLGYAGVMPRLSPDHPLGPHFEIGCRFLRTVWGLGYATESAKAALSDALRRKRLDEIASYTSAANVRSQAVMMRLGLRRDPSRDFTAEYERVGSWRGLIWAAYPT